jgi:hypothetical protein
MEIGLFAGPIYNIILIVDCLFFVFLEWWFPRDMIDYVEADWEHDNFVKVCSRTFTPQMEIQPLNFRFGQVCDEYKPDHAMT